MLDLESCFFWKLHTPFVFNAFFFFDTFSKLYWSDWNRESPKIEQSDLDGTNRQVLLQAPEINLPNSLSISSRTGEVCYADAGTQQIGCISPYHRQIRTVASNLTYPFGLTVTGDRFYWTDWTTYVFTAWYDKQHRFLIKILPAFSLQQENWKQRWTWQSISRHRKSIVWKSQNVWSDSGNKWLPIVLQSMSN